MAKEDKTSQMLRKVIEQKDRLANALSDIVHAISNGCHNGLFESAISDMKCPMGKSKTELRFGLCKKAGNCKDSLHCPMSFNLYRLIQAKNKCDDILREHDSALIPFSIDEIPEYDSVRFKYQVSTEWFARRMVRFISWNGIGNEGDDKHRRELSDAFLRLVGFGCDTIGFGAEWRQFMEVYEIRKKGIANGKSEEQIIDELEKVKSKYKCVERLLIASADVHLRIYKHAIIKAIRKNPKRALRWIVLESVLLACEYDFTYDYPGADNGVYGDVFSCLGRMCLASVGLDSDDRFGILEFVNGKDKKSWFVKRRNNL